MTDVASTPTWTFVVTPLITAAGVIGAVLVTQWHGRRQDDARRLHEITLKRAEWEREDSRDAVDRKRGAYATLLDAGEALVAHLTRTAPQHPAQGDFWERAERLIAAQHRLELIAPRSVRRAARHYMDAVLALGDQGVQDAHKKLGLARGALLAYARKDIGIEVAADEFENSLIFRKLSSESDSPPSQ